MIKKIKLNGRETYYTLELKNVKNINLRIRSDQSVYVSANPRVSEKIIESFLKSKSDFILNALDRREEFLRNKPKPKLYVDGETFRILGNDRILKVVKGEKNFVELGDSRIILTVRDPEDTEFKKKTVDKWMRNYCEEILNNVCEDVYSKFKKYGIEFPEIKLRNMVSRWGSCQPNKLVLTFNTALVKVPLECIEYVVVHEFTHFLQPNHSKNFYTRLSALLPDWKERKKELEENSVYI